MIEKASSFRTQCDDLYLYRLNNVVYPRLILLPCLPVTLPSRLPSCKQMRQVKSQKHSAQTTHHLQQQ
jgi:hypothetical protein